MLYQVSYRTSTLRSRNRTSDMRSFTEQSLIHYNPPLYQLSYPELWEGLARDRTGVARIRTLRTKPLYDETVV